MPPRERIDFTHRELEALLPVLGNSIGHPDVMDALFDDDRIGKAAAYRANEKIMRAWRKATTGSPADPEVYCSKCENRGRNVDGPGGQNFGCPGCGHLLGEHPNGPGRCGSCGGTGKELGNPLGRNFTCSACYGKGVR